MSERNILIYEYEFDFKHLLWLYLFDTHRFTSGAKRDIVVINKKEFAVDYTSSASAVKKMDMSYLADNAQYKPTL